jgi:hypothetical protein
MSASSQRFTGTFIKRQFASQSEVATFNSEVRKWFSQRGFAPDASTTFHAVAKADEWKEPGLLLCRRHGSTSRTYVFIPECCPAEEHTQIIGYHVELQGACEEVDQRRRDFESMRTEFQKQFDRCSTSSDAGRPPKT